MLFPQIQTQVFPDAQKCVGLGCLAGVLWDDGLPAPASLRFERLECGPQESSPTRARVQPRCGAPGGHTPQGARPGGHTPRGVHPGGHTPQGVWDDVLSAQPRNRNPVPHTALSLTWLVILVALHPALSPLVASRTSAARSIIANLIPCTRSSYRTGLC